MVVESDLDLDYFGCFCMSDVSDDCKQSGGDWLDNFLFCKLHLSKGYSRLTYSNCKVGILLINFKLIHSEFIGLRPIILELID